MSWFNKISSKNIQFTTEMNSIVSEVFNELNQAIKRNSYKNFRIGYWFTDPYTKKLSVVRFVVDTKNKARGTTLLGWDRRFKLPDRKNFNITYRLYTVLLNPEIKPSGFYNNPISKEVIEHEFAHVIDPKARKMKHAPNFATYKQYVENPAEFDAFTSSFCNRLKRRFDTGFEKPEKVLDWLRSKNEHLNSVSDQEFSDQEFNDFWNAIKNNLHLVRQFKQRVFNTIQEYQLKQKGLLNEKKSSTTKIRP